MPASLAIAHIGAGRFSRSVHGPALQRLAREEGHVRLEGIADLDPARPDRARAFAREFGYRRAFADFREMIATVRPDVIVCTVHPPCTPIVLEEILTYGIPVFTEKPPATTVERARRLAALAREHRVASYVAFNRRRIPAVEFARAWMAECGPLRHIRAEMWRVGRREPDFALLTAVHALDTLRYLGGEIRTIATRRVPYPGTSGPDYFVQVQFASGATGDLAVLVDAGATTERYAVQLEGAHVEVTLEGGEATPFARTAARACRANRVVAECVTDRDGLMSGGFLQEHTAFHASLRAGTSADCTLDDAQVSVTLAAAVQQGHCGELADVAS